MKLKFIQKELKALLTLGLSTGVFFTQPLMAIGKPARTFTGIVHEPGSGDPAKKKAKAKAFASHNNDFIKIYPDAIKKEMHVVAKNKEAGITDFFVFDLEGTLVQNYKMNPKDHYRISGLKRGVYVYRVFKGDEETAAGKFAIR